MPRRCIAEVLVAGVLAALVSAWIVRFLGSLTFLVALPIHLFVFTALRVVVDLLMGERGRGVQPRQPREPRG
jgi:hypothetical protein